MDPHPPTPDPTTGRASEADAGTDPSRAEATGTATSVTLAWSVDGRTFRGRGPIGAAVPLGGYVRVTPPGGAPRIGQVLAQDVTADAAGRQVETAGALLDGVDDPDPFDDAEVVLADDAEVRRVLAGDGPRLTLGALRDRAEVPASLRPAGFNRHTFLCGQSGSGKTYSLGVLLEQLRLHTRLPLLVLDPNGDHVHLGTPADGIDAEVSRAYRAAAEGTTVLGATADADANDDADATVVEDATAGADTTSGTDAHVGTTDVGPLHVRMHELGLAGTAALLELDPVTDREEYNTLVHLLRQGIGTAWGSAEEFAASLRERDEPALRALAMRVENLGVDRMSVWALGRHRTLADRWRGDRPTALIADTSGFASRRERVAVAVAVLQDLWEHRAERQPLLLVVDEAHDVCPAAPADRLQALAVELFTRVAGEGRKYGIHLLLASQRPDKLPDNVLSQCDNLVLMRVNSAADRRALAERFGFAPAGLVEQAGTYGLGEALLAGTFARPPVVARIGRRLTPEGGGDVPTDWADGR